MRIELELNDMKVAELAALWVAVHRHVSYSTNKAIIDAGIANCGAVEFTLAIRDAGYAGSIQDIHA